MLKQRIDSVLVALLIAVLPIMLLTEIGRASAGYFALVIVCVTICFSRPGGFAATRADLTHYRGLSLALLFSVVAALIAIAYIGRMLGGELERALRSFIGTLAVLAACFSLIPQWLRQASWGMTAGVWAAAYYGVAWTWHATKRVDYFPEFNATTYGNLALLLTVLSTLSLGWRLTRFRRTEVAFKLLTIAAGLIALLATQTRGGWLAMPFFIVIGVVLFRRDFSLRKMILPAIVTLIAAGAIFASSAVMRERLQDGIHEVAECSENPNAISSMCVRIQLWRAAWLMFKENPVFGIGANEDFRPVLVDYAKRGIVSDFAGSNEFGEAHNEILHSMAGHGLIGLIALLLIYLVPGWIFAKRLSVHTPQTARVAAAMGLSVCVGFFVFGINELMFRGMRTLGFYTVMLAWLLALSDTRLVGDEQTPKH